MGPAQRRCIHSFEAYAKEIERVEKEIEALEMKLHGRSDITDRRNVVRIMDAAAANTDSMTHSSSETLIESMEAHGLYFLPSGKAMGGEPGARDIAVRSQFVSDMLDYDEALAELDERTGIYNFKGKAPLYRIASCCTNTIFTYENWTNADKGKGACKEAADVDGYYAICRPEHIPAEELSKKRGGSF